MVIRESAEDYLETILVLKTDLEMSDQLILHMSFLFLSRVSVLQ